MKSFLAVHRITMTLKEIIKESNLSITYNELIMLIALSMNTSYVGQIHNRTMIDKASVVRTLASLKKKRYVRKDSSKAVPKYELTPEGEVLIDFIREEENSIHYQLGYGDEKIEEITETLADMADKLSLG